MKMLFSSNDDAEMSVLQRLLVKSGIPCAIRHDVMTPTDLETTVYPELWIEKEDDYRLAEILVATRRR